MNEGSYSHESEENCSYKGFDAKNPELTYLSQKTKKEMNFIEDYLPISRRDNRKYTNLPQIWAGRSDMDFGRSMRRASLLPARRAKRAMENLYEMRPSRGFELRTFFVRTDSLFSPPGGVYEVNALKRSSNRSTCWAISTYQLSYQYIYVWFCGVSHKDLAPY